MFGTKKTLRGLRIAALTADGVEGIELTVPRDALRRAGATVDVVSLRAGRLQAMNHDKPGGKFRVDATLDQVDAGDYDGLLIPGGLAGPDTLRQSEAARAFVRGFDYAGKPIAAICHGPWLLTSAGIAGSRVLTSWPGIRDDLVNAGSTWLDEEVVRDGNWVTSRSPEDLTAFVAAAKELYASPYAPRSTSVRVSAPQRRAPPERPATIARWLPRPSMRTAAGLLLLAGGVYVASRRIRGLPALPTNLALADGVRRFASTTLPRALTALDDAWGDARVPASKLGSNARALYREMESVRRHRSHRSR